MKRMLLSLLLAVVCSGLFAQSVDKAKELLKANKFVEAKEEIDKVLLVEKNQKNAEAWYVKVRIYDTIGYERSIKNPVSGCIGSVSGRHKKLHQVRRQETGIADC